MLKYGHFWGIRRQTNIKPEADLLEYKAVMEFCISLGILSIFDSLETEVRWFMNTGKRIVSICLLEKDH